MRSNSLVSIVVFSSLLATSWVSQAQTVARGAVNAAGGSNPTGGAYGTGGFTADTAGANPTPAVATSVLGGGSGTPRSANTTWTTGTPGTTGTTGSF